VLLKLGQSGKGEVEGSSIKLTMSNKDQGKKILMNQIGTIVNLLNCYGTRKVGINLEPMITIGRLKTKVINFCLTVNNS
jgi:hypothetical protein